MSSPTRNAKQPGGCSLSLQHGFTMIELIVVILLLGIISAVVFPRFDGIFAYQNATFHSSLHSGLKLTQKTALAQHATTIYWRLDRLSDKSWQLRIMSDDDPDDATPPTEVTPDTISQSLQADTGLSYSVSGAVSGSILAGESLVLMYNQLGDMVRLKESPTASITYPAVADAVNASLALTLSNGSLCVSQTGFSYAGSCR